MLLVISPGKGKIGKKTPAKKAKHLGQKIIKLNNYFEGTSLSPNTSMFNQSPTNLFACMDRPEPDISVGNVRRDVIGQPDRDGIGRKDCDQPGLGLQERPEEEKGKKSDSRLSFRQL